MTLSDIDALKQRLDAMRPLPPEAVRNLREGLVLNWTYHSNAIEGNTLTLLETKVVLEGITVSGKLLQPAPPGAQAYRRRQCRRVSQDQRHHRRRAARAAGYAACARTDGRVDALV
jgi:Fic family protein